MEKSLKSEVLKYISQETYYNIIDRNPKCVGVYSPVEALNENKKRVGRILMIHYSDSVPQNKRKKSLLLNMFVEFHPGKITYRATKVEGHYSVNSGFYLVDPYFVKPYIPEPRIEVPITIRNDKDNRLENIIQLKTYKEFQEHRLDLFFVAKKWPYHHVKAYKNFRKMFAKSGQYYMGINSTKKYCWISQAELTTILADVDNFKKKIKTEWVRYLQDYVAKNNSFNEIQEFFEKETAIVVVGNNVVNFEDFS